MVDCWNALPFQGVAHAVVVDRVRGGWGPQPGRHGGRLGGHRAPKVSAPHTTPASPPNCSCWSQAERANKGILITTSRCTTAALEFVEGKPLEIVDGTRLHSLLHQHGIGAGTPSVDHPRVPPGIQLAYAQLCKPLEAMMGESRRISDGLVFVQAQPLDVKRYVARLKKELQQTSVTMGLVMSLSASIFDEMNRSDPSAEDLARLRLHIKEFLGTLRSFLDEQKRAYAIVPPEEFSKTHAIYRRIAPDVLGKFAVLSERLRDAVEGRLKRGEHLLVELTFDSLTVTEFAQAFKNDLGRLQKRCFVATAAYGDPLDPRVVAFRSFRDRHLLPYPTGRRLVDLYYLLSPPMAAVIARAFWARWLTRALLAPAATLVMRLDKAPSTTGNSGRDRSRAYSGPS